MGTVGAWFLTMVIFTGRPPIVVDVPGFRSAELCMAHATALIENVQAIGKIGGIPGWGSQAMVTGSAVCSSTDLDKSGGTIPPVTKNW